MVNWSAYTKHIQLSTVTTQVKTKTRKAPIDEGKGAWVRRRVRYILMMDKARSCARA